MHAQLKNGKSTHRWFSLHHAPTFAQAPPAAGDADALFIWRDNDGHRDDIEHHYRLAIRLARYRVIIANAYFFPGYSFLRELRKAARRGVQVSLILQGRPDMPIVQTAAAMLYDHLLSGGVRIYEYIERPLHGKVAVVDDEWATIGSSNLDPLSLSLNLEANVMIRHQGFNQLLSAKLQRLMAYHCRKVEANELHESSLWRKIRSFVLFHVLRRYPSWAGSLPAHAPLLKRLQPVTPSDNAPGLDKTAWPKA
jgi:cardiolipin synthase